MRRKIGGIIAFCVFVAVLIANSSARAATITASAATPDTASAIEFNTVGSIPIALENDGSGTAKNGQSFKHATAFTLERFIVRVSTVSGSYAGGNMDISIWEDADNNGSLETQIGATQIAAMPGSLTAGTYLIFDINPVAVAANTTYSFGLAWDTSVGGHNIGLTGSGTDVYANGSVAAGGTGLIPGLDLVFYTYAPEPTSFALLAIGSVMVLGRRRRA